ncbi:unnamed protein product [Lepeophtheirus salmonis]|uniref:(salmon louse) hypothetical protein n=1 Tax=Lepeophtheirus salmonis TaxID=72036 RepID=A0A7R8CS80_LEPSM|nr:unnamed protein product [Lepeophtheirus salmonis]CAF2914391.1 unnamed protein product [Lepeophtheirus salmonis]
MKNVSDEGSCRMPMTELLCIQGTLLEDEAVDGPNGIVPYTIGSSFSSSNDKLSWILLSTFRIEHVSNLLKRTNEANYVDIFTGGDGHAMLILATIVGDQEVSFTYRGMAVW